MLVYIGKRFTASAIGSRLERVVCEKCNTEYHYVLSRVRTGTASAPYMLGVDSAADRAQGRAQRDLARQLQGDVELVPCPNCLWVNEGVVLQFRRRRYRSVTKGALSLAMLGAVIAGFTYYFLRQDPKLASKSPEVVAGTIACVFAAIIVVMLAARAMVRRRIDPNQSFPSVPAVPPGTPPAMFLRSDLRTGQRYLEPAAPKVPSAPTPEDDRVILRVGQSIMLPLCMACGAPAATTFSSPFTLNANTGLKAPVCAACASSRRGKWWLMAALTVIGVVGVGAALAWGLPGLDDTGRIILFCMFAIVGALVGVAIVPAALSRPFSLRTLDSQRGVSAFAAISTDYNRALKEKHAPGVIVLNNPPAA